MEYFPSHDDLRDQLAAHDAEMAAAAERKQEADEAQHRRDEALARAKWDTAQALVPVLQEFAGKAPAAVAEDVWTVRVPAVISKWHLYRYPEASWYACSVATSLSVQYSAPPSWPDEWQFSDTPVALFGDTAKQKYERARQEYSAKMQEWDQRFGSLVARHPSVQLVTRAWMAASSGADDRIVGRGDKEYRTRLLFCRAGFYWTITDIDVGDGYDSYHPASDPKSLTVSFVTGDLMPLAHLIVERYVETGLLSDPRWAANTVAAAFATAAGW